MTDIPRVYRCNRSNRSLSRGLVFRFDEDNGWGYSDGIEESGAVRSRKDDHGAGIPRTLDILLQLVAVLGQLAEQGDVELLLLFRNDADLEFLDD